MFRMYQPGFRVWSVPMVSTVLDTDPVLTEMAGIRQVASRQQVWVETLRRWLGKAQIDTGQRPGRSVEESVEIKKLKKRVVELERTSEFLKQAPAFFRRGTRPASHEMITFIDKFRVQFGVEFICRALGTVVAGFLTSGGYRAAKSRPVPVRVLRDQELVPIMEEMRRENYGVYGVRKMRAALDRAGHNIGREQTRRLMPLAWIKGVRRGGKVFTTVSDALMAKLADLVNRDFTVATPNR